MHTKAKEDLALIRRLMEDSRREVVDRGKHFLIWGVIPVVGLVATYARATTGAGPDPRWVWMGVLVVGWGASMVVGWRDGRRQRVFTTARRILTATWVAMAVTLTLIALGGMFGALVDVRALPGLLSVTMAPAVLLTAVLTGERWLTAVAVGWWLGGGVMLFVPGLYTLLLMAAMALLLLAVPGVVLYARSRRRDAEVGGGVAETT